MRGSYKCVGAASVPDAVGTNGDIAMARDRLPSPAHSEGRRLRASSMASSLARAGRMRSSLESTRCRRNFWSVSRSTPNRSTRTADSSSDEGLRKSVPRSAGSVLRRGASVRGADTRSSRGGSPPAVRLPDCSPGASSSSSRLRSRGSQAGAPVATIATTGTAAVSPTTASHGSQFKAAAVDDGVATHRVVASATGSQTARVVEASSEHPRPILGHVPGFAARVAECNEITEADLASSYVPLIVAGKSVGLMQPSFADELVRHGDGVFARVGKDGEVGEDDGSPTSSSSSSSSGSSSGSHSVSSSPYAASSSSSSWSCSPCMR
mmetsp:Transcript_11276/g.47099  ORF Transcript_11276/g.47099 Transcript_11276/m.47099 type:complete len:323 (-) Transcript_11276:995-1963(-)